MYLASYNRCNLPSWVIASPHYNRAPQPLEIQGARHDARFLLKKLDGLSDQEAHGSLFHDFMDVRFQLHQWHREETRKSRKSLKNSYLRFLRGWHFDSNSVEGAVLKGWVESRFGLRPTFHREPIDDISSPTYHRYTFDRMKGLNRTSAILSQFDLLYEFTQYEVKRRFPDITHLILYRGVFNFSEFPVMEKQGKNRYTVRLNNLNSFTHDFERAWEFGSRVLESEVPLTKIFFMDGLLPKALFKGEEEVMVLGGEYDVSVRIGG